MIDREQLVRKFIIESYDEAYYQRFREFVLTDPEPVREAGTKTLYHIERKSGMCTIMSAYMGALLTDEFNLPAVVVTGNLIISGMKTFYTDVRIQRPNQTDVVMDDWEGHTWVEMGGMILDPSLCRTADLRPDGSRLKAFIHSHFGESKGLIAFPVTEAYKFGMIYEPKEVLNDTIVTAIIKSHKFS